MAQLSNTSAPGHWSVYDEHFKLTCDCTSYDMHMKKEQDSFDVLRAESEEAIRQGNCENYIYSQGVADGLAMYRVISTKPLMLQHIPVGDAYRIHPATIRGLRLSDITEAMTFDHWWRSRASEQKE